MTRLLPPIVILASLLVGCGKGDPEDSGATRPECDEEITFYADGDGDGYGTPTKSKDACEAPSGYVAEAGDCDDEDETLSPGAEEVCDEIDNNCDGGVDEGVTTTYYLDADADGYGVGDGSVAACSAPTDYVEVRGDCDNSDASINPDADEVCDGVDNNCSGDIDGADAIDKSSLFEDKDGDAFGNPDVPVEACPGDGVVADDGDCDDEDAAVNPDAEEVCDDEIDNNCNGFVGVPNMVFDEESGVWVEVGCRDAEGEGGGGT